MTPSLPFLRLNTKSQNRIYLKENVHLLQSTKEEKEINNVLGDRKSLSVLCPPLDEFKLWQWKKILKDKVLQYANCYYLSDSMTECHQHSLMHFPLKKKRFNAHLVCAFTERCKKTTPFSSILPHKGGGNLWTGLYGGDDEEKTGHSSLSCSRSHGWNEGLWDCLCDDVHNDDNSMESGVFCELNKVRNIFDDSSFCRQNDRYDAHLRTHSNKRIWRSVLGNISSLQGRRLIVLVVEGSDQICCQIE